MPFILYNSCIKLLCLKFPSIFAPSLQKTSATARVLTSADSIKQIKEKEGKKKIEAERKKAAAEKRREEAVRKLEGGNKKTKGTRRECKITDVVCGMI